MSQPASHTPSTAQGESSLPLGKSKAEPGLTLVSTPLGNAEDITLRALSILRTADAIACEDTRVTGPFMARYGIGTPLISYHEHNAARVEDSLLRKMLAGQAIALVSDAGTPLVSDPGFRLVKACLEREIPVTAAPGPSAPIMALTMSGLPAESFFFGGFLPSKQKARRDTLHHYSAIPSTLIFFESPQRVHECLSDMADILGPRPAAVTREMTKLFEEVRRGPLPALADHYGQHPKPKGEIVIVVGPPDPAARQVSDAEIDAFLHQALSENSTRDAAQLAAEHFSLPKKDMYNRALKLTQKLK